MEFNDLSTLSQSQSITPRVLHSMMAKEVSKIAEVSEASGLPRNAIHCPGFKCSLELPDDYVISLKIDQTDLLSKYFKMITNITVFEYLNLWTQGFSTFSTRTPISCLHCTNSRLSKVKGIIKLILHGAHRWWIWKH